MIPFQWMPTRRLDVFQIGRRLVWNVCLFIIAGAAIKVLAGIIEAAR